MLASAGVNAPACWTCEPPHELATPSHPNPAGTACQPLRSRLEMQLLLVSSEQGAQSTTAQLDHDHSRHSTRISAHCAPPGWRCGCSQHPAAAPGLAAGSRPRAAPVPGHPPPPVTGVGYSAGLAGKTLAAAVAVGSRAGQPPPPVTQRGADGKALPGSNTDRRACWCMLNLPTQQVLHWTTRGSA